MNLVLAYGLACTGEDAALGIGMEQVICLARSRTERQIETRAHVLQQPRIDSCLQRAHALLRRFRIGQEGIEMTTAAIEQVGPCQIKGIEEAVNNLFHKDFQIKRPAPQGF